ncbi:MAG: hypothetical protein IJ489_04335 [Clostridia bacterium]|nr:hypothetical protein [Clostridia bacterium]
MKKTRIVGLLLVFVLVTSCFVGGTFAKYASTAYGSDVATIAKWSIEVEGTDIAVAGSPVTVAFDLFDTINDTGNADDETDVTDNLIAPGTAGSFKIDIINNAEVNAEYTIELSETNIYEVPLQYSVDGTNWVDSIDELEMDALTTVAIDMNGGTDNQTVYWRWVFNDTDTAGSAHADQNNAYDTGLGVAAKADPIQVIINATIRVEQVD